MRLIFLNSVSLCISLLSPLPASCLLYQMDAFEIITSFLHWVTRQAVLSSCTYGVIPRIASACVGEGKPKNEPIIQPCKPKIPQMGHTNALRTHQFRAATVGRHRGLGYLGTLGRLETDKRAAPIMPWADGGLRVLVGGPALILYFVISHSSGSGHCEMRGIIARYL